MKHARKDYQERIVDLAGLIPADEPVFFIRGKDINAPATLEFWANLAEKNGADSEIVGRVREHAAKMRRYQEIHGNKIPDMPE